MGARTQRGRLAIATMDALGIESRRCEDADRKVNECIRRKVGEMWGIDDDRVVARCNNNVEDSACAESLVWMKTRRRNEEEE